MQPCPAGLGSGALQGALPRGEEGPQLHRRLEETPVLSILAVRSKQESGFTWLKGLG